MYSNGQDVGLITQHRRVDSDDSSPLFKNDTKYLLRLILAKLDSVSTSSRHSIVVLFEREVSYRISEKLLFMHCI